MPQQPNDQELRFVVNHYRKDAFNPDEALKELRQPARRMPLRRWVAVAASLLCIVVFAAVLTWQAIKPSTPVINNVPVPSDKQEVVAQPAATFHFDDTPLPEVLDQIGRWYGVELRADNTEKHLTGDFSADSLGTIIGMIEEVLDVEIVSDPKKQE